MFDQTNKFLHDFRPNRRSFVDNSAADVKHGFVSECLENFTSSAYHVSVTNAEAENHITAVVVVVDVVVDDDDDDDDDVFAS